MSRTVQWLADWLRMSLRAFLILTGCALIYLASFLEDE